ncbi:MAG: family 16 glycoside hydrolase, partial [Thermoleophilia bacterium]
MGRPGFLRRRIGKRFAKLVVLVLVFSFALSLVPQNVLSVNIGTVVEAPLFTSIPPVTASGNDLGTGATETGQTLPLDESQFAQPSEEFLDGTTSVAYGYGEILDGAAQIVYLGSYDLTDSLILQPDDSIAAESPKIRLGGLGGNDLSLPVYAIKIKAGSSEAELAEVASRTGALMQGRVPGTNIFKLQCGTSDAEGLIAELLASSIVEAVERDRRYGPDRVNEATQTAAAALRSKLIEVSPAQDSYWEDIRAARLEAGVMEQPVEAPAPIEATPAADAAFEQPAVAYSPEIQADSAAVDQYATVTGSEETPALVEPVPVPATPEPVPTTSSATPTAALYDPTLYDPALSAGAPDGNTGLMQDDSMSVTKPALPEDGAAQTSYPMTPQIASVESEAMVPVKAVESSIEPTEYAAPTGDVDVRFASSLAAGTKLVDVSRGDKGFSIRVAGSKEDVASGSAAIVSDNGIGYVDSDGAHILFTPTANGLSAEVAYAEGSANTISLDLPLYGLFAEQTEDGSIALIDIDTGKRVFTILVPSGAGNAASTGATKLSLITAADYNVSLLIGNLGTGQSNLRLITWSAAGSYIPVVGRIKVRYENDAQSLEDAGLSLAIAGAGDSTVPQGYLASLGLKDGRINYGPLSSDRVRPVKFGEYTEFAGEAGFASLRIKPISYGVEQEIALNAVPASNRFELPLSLSSLSLISTPSGNLDVIDATGSTVATIDADLMYDSRPASEGGPARSDLVQLELVELADGTKKLVITADADWLNDPARVYPVFIDPTTTTQYPGASTILPSATPSLFWSYSDPTYSQADAFIQIATDAGHKVFNPDNTYSIVYDHLIYASSGLGAATRFTLPAANALQEGVYYWRSWVKNSNGDWACSNCNSNTDPFSSPAQVFYVNTTHVYSLYGAMPARLPVSATAATTVTIPITLKNRGPSTWNATGSDYYALSYGLTWTDSTGLHGDKAHSLQTMLPYDLPSGQEVILNAKLKIPAGTSDDSTVTVNWDMVQNGVCWFSDRGEHPFMMTATAQTGWNASYVPTGTPADWQGIPAGVDAGGNLQLNMYITNTGTMIWNAETGPNIMKVGARWFDASGNEVLNQKTASLDSNMGPGARMPFNLTISAPGVPGAYILKLDMWNSTTGEWLSSQGVSTLDLPIMVSAYGILPAVSYARINDSMQLNLVSGNLVMSATDFTSNGRGPPINITRTLNTLSADAGAFGKGWSSILDSKLNVFYNADQTVQSVKYLSADGSALTFIASQIVSGYQTFIHPRGLFLTLKQKQSDGTFQLVNQDQTLIYNFGAPASGVSRLHSIVDNNGNTTTFNYSGGNISSISEASGDSARSVQIGYVPQGQNGAGNVKYIKVPSSDSIRNYSFWAYGYDENNQLTSAEFDPANDPDTGNANASSLAIPTNYAYSGLPARFTGITTRYGPVADNLTSTTTLLHDSSGRLTNIHDPRYTDHTGISIAYTADAAGRSVSVTNAAGAAVTYFLGRSLQIAGTTTTQLEPIFEENFAGSDLGNWTQVSTNIAFGKATSSSGYYNSSYGPHHIVDGSITENGTVDYWLPPDNQDVNNPAWAQVDLGTSHVVNEIRFLPTHDGSTLKRATRNWHITVSNDGLVWTDLARGTLPGAIKVGGQVSPMAWTDVRMSPSLVRYVRFHVDSYSGYGGGLNEIQVYGVPMGAVPTAAWSVGLNPDPAHAQEKVIKAAPFSATGLGDEVLVSRDSYSDFSFESSIRMSSQRDVGIAFRVTNSKTDLSAGDGGVGGDTGPNGNLGYYFFRASGMSVDGSNATLWKRENGYWTQLQSVPFSAPALNQWYKLRVEAVGSTIKCYYNDFNTPLISVNDSSFTRGRVGLRAESTQNTTPLYFFGSAYEGAIKVYGKAYSTFTHDAEGSLAGQNQALSSTANKYDDEVHGWSAQLPEQRFSIRQDAAAPANNVLYADDYDAPNIIWGGDTSWTSYTVEARVKLLYAGQVDLYWPAGGNAGIVFRSSGDPENGYYVGLAPNVTVNGVYLWRMQGLASNTLLKYGGTTPPVVNQWITLKVVVRGSNVKVYTDNNFVFEHNDTAIANGKVGLKVATARAVFDDVKITGPDGSVWKYDDFQAKGLLSGTLSVDRVSGLPSGESYLYDASNRPYVRTDQNKRRTTVTRDEKGNVICEADPAGTIKLNEYDSYGNLLSQTAPMQPSYNYVPNPSFEDTTDWSVLPRGTTSSVTYDSTNSYHGTSSIKLTHNGTDDWIGAQTSVMPVKAGEDYTVSAFVKSTGFTPGTSSSDGMQHQHVYLRFWSSNDPGRSSNNYKGEFGAVIPASATGYDWQRIFETVAVPNGATYADVLIAIVGGGGVNSTVWIDGVQLEPGAAVPAFNYLDNPGAENYTGAYTSLLPENGTWIFEKPQGLTSMRGSVGGATTLASNWILPVSGGWAVNSFGQMGVTFWNGRGGQSETTLASVSTFSGETTFQADLKMTTGKDMGLAFRIQDDDNMYFIRCSGYEDDKLGGDPAAKTALWKKVNGGWTRLTNSGSAYIMNTVPAMDAWYTVKVTTSGGSISWSYAVNGTWSQTYTAVDATWTSGKIGFRAGTNNTYSQADHLFDGVVVTSSIPGQSFTDNFGNWNLPETGEWAENDKGEMGVFIWPGRNSFNESTLWSARSFSNQKSVTFQADIKMIDGRNAGLAFRIQDASNMYFVRCSGDEDDRLATGDTVNKTTLWKKVNGTWIRISDSGSSYTMAEVPAMGQWYTVKVTMSGSDITWSYSFDGGETWLQTYSAYDSTWFSGRLGLRVGTNYGSSQASHHFDNVIITDDNRILSDHFNGGTVGTWQNTGTSWTVLQDSGNNIIQGNGLAAVRVTWKDVGLSDFIYEAKVKVVETNLSTATAGLVLRSDASSNGQDINEYYFGIYPGQSLWKIWRVVNGSFGAVTSGSQAFSINVDYTTLKARAEGGQIRFYINGEEKATYTDLNPYTHTCVGLRTRNAKANFDAINVQGLGTAASLGFNDYFTVSNPYLTQSHDDSTSVTSSWRQGLSQNTVVPGQNYTLSAVVYTDPLCTGSGGARLHLVWKDTNNEPISGKDEYSPFYITGGDPLRKAITAVAPEGATSATIYLEQYAFQGQTRLDDVRFERTIGQGGFSSLANGSFETIYAVTGKPTGWSYDNLSNWSLDTKSFKFGKSSVLVSTQLPADSYAGQTVKVEPNTTYVLSAWIKTSAVAGSRGSGALLHVLSGGECYTTVPVTGDTDWSLQTIQFTTGPNVNSILVGIQQGFGGPSSGSSWFDGIQLVEKSSWETSYSHDSSNNFVNTVVSPTGALTEYDRDTAGQVVYSYEKQRAANGTPSDIKTTNVFDNAGRLIQTSQPDPSVYGQSTITTTYEYDKSGHKLGETDVYGNRSTYTYDAAGHNVIVENPHTQIFADNFASGLSSWTPNNSAWNEYGDAGNSVYKADSPSAATASWHGDLQNANYSISARIKITGSDSGNAGLLLRSDGAPGNLDKNQYYLGIYPSAGEWRLYKWTGGVQGSIALKSGSGTFAVGQYYTLSLKAQGSQIRIYIDGIEQNAATPYSDPSPITAGRIGLRVASTVALFDDVVATETGNTSAAHGLAGYLSSTTVSLGDNAIQTTYVTDGMGRVTSRTTGGITVKATYDELGNKLTETDAMGSVSRYVYDAQGVCAAYDRLGNLTSTIRSIDQDNLSLSASIDAAGYMEIDKANAAGVIATTDKRNNAVSNTYSSGGSLASRVDAALSPWLFAYDVTGRPGLFQDPFGGEIRFAYDTLGRLGIRTDARGLTQKYTYDNLGRVLSRVDKAGTAGYTWDLLGRMSTVTNAGDSTAYVSYSYDGSGKLVKATYGFRSAAYGYSSFGRIGNIRDFGLGATAYSYDSLGRSDEIMSSYFSSGAKLTLGYDSNGNMISRSNPDGTSSIYWYDKENRMVLSAIMKNNAVLSGTTHAYDSRGNRTSTADLKFVDEFSGSLNTTSWYTSEPSQWATTPEKTLKVTASTPVDTVLRSLASYSDAVFTSQINMQQKKNVGMVVRCQDINNLYMVRASGMDLDAQGRPLMVIYKKQAGAWTLKATALIAAPAMGSWYSVSVKTEGRNISAIYSYIDLQGKNCSSVASYNDTDTTAWTGGYSGFISYPEGGTNIHSFDSVTITAL